MNELSNKIIVSSSAFWRFLSNLESSPLPDYLKVIKKDGFLKIENVSSLLNVDANHDFETEVTPEQVLKLRRILSVMQDQPITISFPDNNSSWININSISIS